MLAESSILVLGASDRQLSTQICDQISAFGAVARFSSSTSEIDAAVILVLSGMDLEACLLYTSDAADE